MDANSLPDNIQDEFVDLTNDYTVKDAYKTLSLVKFWLKMAESYPLVSTHVVKPLLVFPSTYLCERDSHPCTLSRPNIVPDWL